MEALIRTYQLWVGIQNHVLSDTQPCPWIPNHWLTSLCQSLHQLSTKLCYQSWTISPLRQGDHFLMDDFNNQDFPWHKLEKLNACQMYLQVTTLSEIMDHMGTEILQQVLANRPNEAPKGLTNISYSTLQWLIVRCPSPTCWHMWTSTICTLYMGSAKGTRLTQALGPWLTSYANTCFWHWCLLDVTHLVYRHTPMAPM